jgi:hypothetical protein
VFRRELTALTVNVPGLKPATNYTYRVFALNDAGDSDPVGGVVATQGLCDPTLIPSAVTNLTATPGATVGKCQPMCARVAIEPCDGRT